MLRAPRSAVLVILGLVLSFRRSRHARRMRPQSAFTLQNFRPAVDSKGYVTVNASQILGHLDFSLGLVGSYAHNVLNLRGNGNAEFNVEHLMTPQLQFAIGLFKWVELGVSLPVQIMFGNRAPAVQRSERRHEPQNNQLSFCGQFVGDIGFHVKARFLNTSKYPVGLGLLVLAVRAVGRLARSSSATARSRCGPSSSSTRSSATRAASRWRSTWARSSVRRRTPTPTSARRSSADPDGQRRRRLLPAGADHAWARRRCRATRAAARSRRARSARSSPTGSACRTPSCRSKFDIVGEASTATPTLTGAPASARSKACSRIKVYLARKSFFEIGGGAGLLPAAITSKAA